LQIAGCPTRYVHGIVAQLGEGFPLVERGDVAFVPVKAVLVPKLWLLTRRKFSRVFQEKTVKQVLESYFKDVWHLPYSPTFLKRTYESRPLFVQYQESDFDFVSRLMEEEGIRYYFTHDRDCHTLVLRDDPMAHADVPAPTTLTFSAVEETR